MAETAVVATERHSAKYNYAALIGEGLAPAGTDLRMSHGALTPADTRCDSPP